MQAAADRPKTITVVVPEQKFKRMIIVSAEKRKFGRERKPKRKRKERHKKAGSGKRRSKKMQKRGGLPLNLGWVPVKTNKKSPSRKMNEKGGK